MEKAEEQKSEAKPVVDAFGQPRTADGSPVSPEAPTVEPEKKQEPVVDLENHEVVVGLKKQLKDLEDRNSKLEDDKSNMGRNLSGQRQKMDNINKRVKEAESEVPFPNIQRAKDLKKEELEQMTEFEKRQMDTTADLQEQINKQHIANRKKEIEAEEATSSAEEAKGIETAFQTKVQSEALKLSGDDKAMANQIIENFNLFKDNEKLTDKELKERLTKAAAMTEGYKSPKEQKHQQGKAVAAAAGGDDPFGNMVIINTVNKGQQGGYSL